MSLARALSKLGAASRSAAAALVAAGRVTVDGRVVRDPGHRLDLARARVALDGAPLVAPARVTLLLHKPRGVVTTRSDPEGRPTVFDLLGEAADRPRLVAVGRLDLATSGLLLLTSDGRLADWLTDPRQAIARRYAVTVAGELADEAAARMCAGIDDDGERLRAVGVEIRKRSRRETHLRVTLAEGRNREVRRLCAAVGHEVTALRRDAFGGLELGEVAAGRWRAVGDDELRRAFPGVEALLARRR